MSTLTHAATRAQTTWFDGPHGAEGPPFPFILIPLFWLVLLAGVTVAVILGRRRRDHVAGRVAGERALAERYAAGEIDETEYRSRRSVLREKE